MLKHHLMTSTAELLWTGMALVLLGRWMLPYVIRFLTIHGLTEMNYRRECVPTAGGLLIWLLVLLQSAIFGIAVFFGFHFSYERLMPSFYMTSLHVIALLGFIDDAVGAKTKAKGIAAHWKLWTNQQHISTGMVKAGGILAAAVPVVAELQQVHRTSWYIALMQIVLIGLMANGLNLLDLRPGRALKGFWTLLLLLCGWIVTFHSPEAARLLLLGMLPGMLPLICGALVLFVADLKGRLMLGDTGANMLGFALGCGVVASSGWGIQIAVLGFLVLLHALTWRWSLSAIIERNRLLMWLDRLGREDAGKIGGA